MKTAEDQRRAAEARVARKEALKKQITESVRKDLAALREHDARLHRKK